MRQIGLLVSHRCQASSLRPLALFERANAVLGERRYVNRLFSAHAGPVTTACGVNMLTNPLGRGDVSVLFVTDPLALALLPAPVTDSLFEACWAARRLAVSSRGIVTLAELGLLDRRCVATHRLVADEVRERFPLVRVLDVGGVIADGPIWTSARALGGLDLALRLLEQDLGAEQAQVIAASVPR